MKTKLFLRFGLLIAICTVAMPGYCATQSSGKQSAIQQGTKVRAKTTAAGLYNQECYDAYYGCMDQFCILDNEDGGSCACSDKNAGYEARLEKIKDTLTEADRLQTEEVERVQAGANADIIFNGTRTYDKKTGDVAKNTKSAAEKRKSLLAMWDDTLVDDDDGFDSMESIADKTGDALFAAADELCRSQIDMDTCSKDVKLLKQMYSRQIVSDCKGFENSIVKKEAEAKIAMNSANAAVRSALKESLDSANKYDRGECMVEYKKCMQGVDACGKDWENCVFTVAGENMQNNAAVSTAKTKVKKTVTYDITDSTMEILESKRYICERVLDQCVAVRDNVWNDFLREAAPTIKLAESKIESKKRQSCLTDISNCIQKACKDDIEGKGVETMDACLARPDMARSFCKVEIDPCERMEPQIWAYVKDKLAAMRVDACTAEVKDCFTDENRCGENFQNCIGMDYAYIHDICPIDKLVVCKQANPKFSMSDLDSMLMGLYLNIDNAALETCQNLVTEKMTEVCGSTTDCNKFAADEVIGTGSLRSQKDGDVYRVTGMISFGSIKMGDASGNTKDGEDKLGPGEIGVADYIARVNEKFSNEPDADAIIPTIEEELNNIAGTINRTIEMIEQDPKIQYCITGRNLDQITGKKGEKTTARFPNLLNQVKMQIAISALRQAQDNYNKKFTAAVAEATKDASLDVAQYMCQKVAQPKLPSIFKILAKSGESASTPGVDAELTPPYAISYDVSTGLKNVDLTKTGAASNSYGFTNSNGSGGSTTTEVTATFSRDTRNCHICRTVSTQSCSTKGGNWFRKANTSCSTSAKDPVCEDVKM